MDDIGVVTPELMRAMVDDFRRRQQLAPHVQSNYPYRRPIDEPSPHRVFVKNTSSEVCPAFGCMQITGTEVVAGITVVKVTKPTTTDGEYLFNSQFSIAAGENGWAFRFGVVVMLGDGTAPTAANAEYLPVVASWSITEGSGPFVVFGEHNVVTDALIGRFIGGGGGGGRIWFTVVSMDCEQSPWVLTVEVTYYSGGCEVAIPGADQYDGYVEVENFCDIADHFTPETIVGKSGSASQAYSRDGYSGNCEPVWLLDDICGDPVCQ